MPAALACAAVRSDVGMPTKRRPCRCRRASASTANAAVEPVPRPDDHALLDQLDRRLRRRALQRVAIRIGWDGGGAHGLAAPAVALARIAAMAAL